MTKKQTTMYNNYSRATATSLCGIYKSFSQDKQNSLDKIRLEMIENNGHGLRVFNGNTYQYSAGYIVSTSNGDELHYFTRNNNYIFMV